MTVHQIKLSAKKIFYGKYKDIALYCSELFTIILIKKCTELASLYFLITENFISMNELFISDFMPWHIFRLMLELVCFVLVIPLYVNIFRILTNKNEKSFRVNFRFAFIGILIKILNTVSFLPTAICIYLSFGFLKKAYEIPDSESYFSVSFMLAMLSVIFLWFYAYIMTGTVLAPFICIKNPEKNVFSVIAVSFSSVSGNRTGFIKLVICSVPVMTAGIFIPAIPFILSKIFTWYSVFAENALKDEKEYYYNEEYNISVQ